MKSRPQKLSPKAMKLVKGMMTLLDDPKVRERMRKWNRRQLRKLSRQQLKANGFDPRGIPGDVCIELANQHMRAFLGMDRPNLFAGTVINK